MIFTRNSSFIASYQIYPNTNFINSLNQNNEFINMCVRGEMKVNVISRFDRALGRFAIWYEQFRHIELLLSYEFHT
jgi:hypothetical protein